VKVYLDRRNLPEGAYEEILKVYENNVISKDQNHILVNIPENEAVKIQDLYKGLIDVSE